MTEEEALALATQEVEDSKPLTKNVDNVVTELTDEDYDQRIQDLKNFKLDQYHNSYKYNRQMAYLPIPEQLDMMYWDSVNGTTTWQDHIAQVKADNPKPE